MDIYAGVDLIDDVAISEDAIMVSPININPKKIINGRRLLFIPGLIDMHVHFREPGFIHKEDISSGIKAALGGGVTSVLVMPNTNPAIDQVKHVHYQMKRARSFNLMVAASASKGLLGKEPTNIYELARVGVKAITDDGYCVIDSLLLEKIFRQCRLNNVVFMQHAEDKSISQGAPFHDGLCSKKLKASGQPAKAEWGVIERDLKLAQAIGCRYHALHVSCQESLKLIKEAKKISPSISCEVTPHHLLLNEFDVRNKNPNAKMNPPLRSKEDVFALLQGLCDESVDVVASDHAPHSCREKRKGIDDAPFGVVGLESTILVLLTLVKKYGLPLSRAIASMTTKPAFVLKEVGFIGTMIGEKAKKNAVLLDPECRSIFLKRSLLGRSYNSPFLGMELFGKVKATFLGGHLVYGDNCIL
jgi:dihydroorotase